MNYLVTGGCGFIGVNLVNTLLKEGARDITVLDNLSSGKLEYLERMLNEHGNVERSGGKNRSIYRSGRAAVKFMMGDIRDARLASEITKGMDAVVHLAAQPDVIPSIKNPREDMEVNVGGTLNFLEACRKNDVEKFIFASSNAPLGEQPPPVDETKAPKPISPYGASKLAGEAYCSAYHGAYGLKTISLRFSNVYGPRSYQKESVIPKFIKRGLKKQPLIIYGDGNQTRDFLYVDDLSEAMLKSIESDIGGEVLQIATGKETSINELAVKIKSILEPELGWSLKIKYVRKRKGEITRSYSDISKAKKLLGFTPKIEIGEGLKETWKWFKKVHTAEVV